MRGLTLDKQYIEPDLRYLHRGSKRYKLLKYGEVANEEGALILQCFNVCGAIPQHSGSHELTGIVLDSGASANIIRNDLASKAGLKFIRLTTPQAFELANGSFVYSHYYVRFTLYLAGVGAETLAYIDEAKSSHSMLLGMPGWRAFLVKSNFGYGRRQNECRVTVARDQTGFRRTQYLVPRDNRPAGVRYWAKYEGVPTAMKRGETATERNSREVLERLEARYHKIRAKHSAKVNPEFY